MGALKAMLITIITHLGEMVLGPRFILWGLKLSTKLTSNKVDDYCVEIVDAAYSNDVERLKAAVEKLADKYKAK